MAAPATARRWLQRAHGPASTLELAEVPLPAPKKGEVLVRVLSTCATYTDTLIIQGNYPIKFKLPVTPGYDCVGVVTATGAGVVDLAVGDRIAAMPRNGCATTHLTLRAEQCIKISAAIPPEKASAVVLTGVTAWQMLQREGKAKVRHPLRSVLVHGCAGGTGAMLVQLAKIAGVPLILGTCSAKNVAAATASGVHVAMDYAPGDWHTRALAATEGRGVDVVFDAVVLGGYFDKDVAALAPGGRLVAYGVTNSAKPGSFSLWSVLPLFFKMTLRNALWSYRDGKTCTFFSVPAPGEGKADSATFWEDLRALLALVEAGDLEPVIGKVWPLEGFKDALAGIEAGQHTGKQMIHVADA